MYCGCLRASLKGVSMYIIISIAAKNCKKKLQIVFTLKFSHFNSRVTTHKTNQRTSAYIMYIDTFNSFNKSCYRDLLIRFSLSNFSKMTSKNCTFFALCYPYFLRPTFRKFSFGESASHHLIAIRRKCSRIGNLELVYHWKKKLFQHCILRIQLSSTLP